MSTTDEQLFWQEVQLRRRRTELAWSQLRANLETARDAGLSAEDARREAFTRLSEADQALIIPMRSYPSSPLAGDGE